MSAQMVFCVPGVAVGYDRSSAAMRYTHPNVAAWRRDVQVCYQTARRPPFSMLGEYTGLVGLAIAAAGTRADADNVAKEIMDALSGLAYRDDSQVAVLSVALLGRQLSAVGRARKPGPGVVPMVHVTLEYEDGAA